MKKSLILLLGDFIKENPWSSFWTLLAIVSYFESGLTPILSFPSGIVKLIWVVGFIEITYVMGSVLKRYLFTYKEESPYGIEKLTEWVDDSPVIYFLICAGVSAVFEFVFQSILKDIVMSF